MSDVTSNKVNIVTASANVVLFSGRFTNNSHSAFMLFLGNGKGNQDGTFNGTGAVFSRRECVQQS